MELILKAKQFSQAAHDSIGQTRKYTHEPYWVHTNEVAEIIRTVTTDQVIISAAYLHDVLEDVFPINPYYSSELILREFGDTVLDLVKQLTDVFTHKDYPAFNREKRKELEIERLSSISKEAATIKLADIVSNANSIIEYDPGFAAIYIKEIEKTLPCLISGDALLFDEVIEIINKWKEKKAQ